MQKKKNHTTLNIEESKFPITARKKYWKWTLWVAYGPSINSSKIFERIEDAENNAIKWAERFELIIVEKKLLFAGEAITNK